MIINNLLELFCHPPSHAALTTLRPHRCNRATARRELGDLLGAVEDWEHALRLDPGSKQAAGDRADCVQQLLRQQGLQPPVRGEQVPVTAAAAGGDATVSASGSPAVKQGLAAAASAAASAPNKQPQQKQQRGAVSLIQEVPNAVGSEEEDRVPDLQVPRPQQQQEVQQEQPAQQQQGQVPQRPAPQQTAAPPKVAVTPPAAPSAAAPAAFKPPRTGVDFEKAWRGMRGDLAKQAAYLLALRPVQLPGLLRQALTPGLLADAVLALLAAVMREPGQLAAAAAAALEGLAEVPRFELNMLSVPPRQRAELVGAWDVAAAAAAAVVGESGGGSAGAEQLTAVRRRYKL